jgi:hypothetical protein
LSLDEASFRAASGRRYTTRIEDIFTKLDEADSATLRRVLADRDISHEAVALTLTTSGYPASRNAVRHYRFAVLRWQD